MVEIKLRTLGTHKGSVDVSHDSNIGHLKNAIEKKFGSDFYSSEHQILILNGQNITAFEENIANLELKNSDSIIVIGYKAREAVAPPAKPQKSSSNEKVGSNVQSNNSSMNVDTKSKTFTQLQEFGFSDQDIMNALSNTDDIEIATEMILNNMKNPTDFTNAGTDSEVTKDDKSESYLKIKEVLDSVDIQSLIKTSRENNQTVLESLCHELLTSNPEGMKLLLQDHETFSKVYSDTLEKLNVEDKDIELGDDGNILGAFGADVEMEDVMNTDLGDAQLIEDELNEEDHEIIKNLTELGYSKEKCTIAYLACNKNPEHAATFLFQDEGEDD